MDIRPTGITANKTSKRLHLTWNDGTASDLPFEVLVAACPCEMCEMERNDPNPLKILRPKSTDLQAIVPVGSYGVNILWNGGCNYGIFTWEYLSRLGDRKGPTSVDPAVK